MAQLEEGQVSAPGFEDLHLALTGREPRRTSPGALPGRVRQANLSPHLRSSPSSGTAAHSHDPEIRSPDQAGSLLASLQSGWGRGR